MSTPLIPLAIPPFYFTKGINEPIDLYKGTIEVKTVDGTWSGSGTIVQDWLPEPAINLDCNYKGTQPEKPQAEIGFPGTPRRFPVSVTSFGFGTQGPDVFATLCGKPDYMVWGSTDPIKRLRFHIANFVWFQGASVQDASADSPRQARATFSAEDWMITIDSVPGFKFGSDFKIEDQSGNAITHVGELVKRDGSLFAISSTDSIFQQLYLWLSFCRGNWVAPMLSVGFDDSGQVVCKDWRQWNIRHCEHLPTWLNRDSSESLSQSFPGFIARLSDSIWAGPIRRVLAWYVECNRRKSGLEASIILCQTALELLGWASLAQDRKVLSQKGFQDLPAADKIRLLLANFEIPLVTPMNLTELRQLSKEYNWSDGPECLVGIRNALVHPQPKNMLKLNIAS
ncbi:MAG: hypothetical protein ACREJN_16815 [Nitrospiraceae bacterium]